MFFRGDSFLGVSVSAAVYSMVSEEDRKEIFPEEANKLFIICQQPILNLRILISFVTKIYSLFLKTSNLKKKNSK